MLTYSTRSLYKICHLLLVKLTGPFWVRAWAVVPYKQFKTNYRVKCREKNSIIILLTYQSRALKDHNAGLGKAARAMLDNTCDERAEPSKLW